MILGAAVFGASSAEAKRLVDRPTGLVLQAPAGFKLKGKDGFYKLSGRGMTVSFARGLSPVGVPQTGDLLVKASGGRAVGKVKKTSRLYAATIRVKGKPYRLSVRKRGKMVDVALFGTGRKMAMALAPRASVAVLSPAQLQQMAALERILNTRRGGANALLNVPVPMRLAQTSDNGARALVPALPGWVTSGGGGLMAVENSRFGFGWFGFTYSPYTPAAASAFTLPPGSVIVPPSADPGVMLAQFFPQYAATLGVNWQFTAIQLLPGSQGILGPTIPSALYAMRFRFNGRPFQAVFVFGILNYSTYFTQLYFSGVAIDAAAPGGISNALVRSWASYSGEVGFRERLSTGLDLIANGKDATLTPSRFRAGASTWIDLVQSGQL